MHFVIISVSRGWVERRKYDRMVATKRQQDSFVQLFFQDVSGKADWLCSSQEVTSLHDLDRQKERASQVEEEKKSRDIADRKRLESYNNI